MTHKDRVGLWSRIGLIIAAFAVIGAIVAEPLLQRVWFPRLTVAHR